ncbi:MAG: PPC domain-containing protein [Spirochaetes bacterium]|nr:PPC domain-containing protein [Spirochaetota bacterium]
MMTLPVARFYLPMAALVWAFGASMAYGAENLPHIGYAFPSGAKQGSKLVVLVGGQNLEGVTNIFITGEKVSGQLVSFNRDLDPKGVRSLERAKAVIEGKMQSASADEKPDLERRLAIVMQQMSYQEPPPSDPEMMKYMMGMKQRKQINAQLTDLARLEVAVEADAAPGRREIRLATMKGVSEPLSFFVGRFDEAVEKEPNDTTRQATAIASLPAVLNGQILPGDIDRFRLKARKGQNLVFAVQARDLMPYLADAVPGWFQAAIALYDEAGKELAFGDHFRQYPDPLLAYTPQVDGDLIVEIRDSIYRGREDFVYRITVGEIPYVTGIFPIGGPLKGKTTVELSGWNLPSPKTVVETKSLEAGLISIAPFGAAAHNPVNFMVEDLPEIRSAGEHHTLASAQTVAFPAAINGRLEKPGDADYFKFSGKAGDRVIADVWARRVGSPLDSALRVFDGHGQVIQTNDDHTDEMAGLVTHHADSYLSFTLPETGEYTVALRDAQGKGGKEYAYRLRLSTPRPDFRLRVTPSCASIPSGGTAALDVHVQRIDGFEGEITLSLAKGGGGATLGGGQIKTLEKVVPITLTIPELSQESLLPQIVGTAKIGGKTVHHSAIAAEEMMQAFAYRHLVSAQELVLKVTDKPKLSLSLEVEDEANLPLAVNKEVSIPIRVLGMKKGAGGKGAEAVQKAFQKIALELESPMKGVSVVRMVHGNNGLEPAVIVKVDGAQIQTGATGNLVFNAYFMSEKAKNPLAGGGNRVFLCTLPAVSCQVVP